MYYILQKTQLLGNWVMNPKAHFESDNLFEGNRNRKHHIVDLNTKVRWKGLIFVTSRVKIYH